MAIFYSWEKRIERARQLIDEASTYSGAREMLAFYLEILKWQRGVYIELSGACREWPITQAGADTQVCSYDDDVAALEHFGSLLKLVMTHGAPAMVTAANELDATKESWRDLLSAWRRGESEIKHSFFARVCLQPYLELSARNNQAPIEESAQPHRLCPFCHRKPQLAFLLDDTGAGGAGRFLMCGDCLTVWSFQRIACPNCHETDPHKLPYYSAKEFPNLRIEACDTCGRYLKSVDLTKDRRLIPTVDELAAVALDLWARERGYIKIQPNLAGI